MLRSCISCYGRRGCRRLGSRSRGRLRRHRSTIRGRYRGLSSPLRLCLLHRHFRLGGIGFACRWNCLAFVGSHYASLVAGGRHIPCVKIVRGCRDRLWLRQQFSRRDRTRGGFRVGRYIEVVAGLWQSWRGTNCLRVSRGCSRFLRRAGKPSRLFARIFRQGGHVFGE